MTKKSHHIEPRITVQTREQNPKGNECNARVTDVWNLTRCLASWRKLSWVSSNIRCQRTSSRSRHISMIWFGASSSNIMKEKRLISNNCCKRVEKMCIMLQIDQNRRKDLIAVIQEKQDWVQVFKTFMHCNHLILEDKAAHWISNFIDLFGTNSVDLRTIEIIYSCGMLTDGYQLLQLP